MWVVWTTPIKPINEKVIGDLFLFYDRELR